MAQSAENASSYRLFAPTNVAHGTLVVLAGTLLIAACAHIAIPLFLTPVPITLQPFAVLLIGLVLGPGLGAATCAAYLLEGVMGLPVFTPQGAGGLVQLLGPTGGYLLSYPAAAALAGALSRMRNHRGLGDALLGAAAANVLILAAGACWLGVLTHQSANAVARAAVLPFLAGDAVKVVLAALLAAAWFDSRFDPTHTGDRA